MLVMYWINKKEFEKKVKEFLQKQNPPPELPQDSSARDSSSRIRDTEDRKTFIAEVEVIIFKETLLNDSTAPSKIAPPKARDEEIKKRYSIEMFEDLLQTVVKLKERLNQVESDAKDLLQREVKLK
jgi:hypothetical protein